MGYFIFGAAQFRLSYAKFFAPGETVEERQLDRESGAIDRFVASEVGRVFDADIQFRPSRISVESDLRIIGGVRFPDLSPPCANIGQFGNKVRTLRKGPLDQVFQSVRGIFRKWIL